MTTALFLPKKLGNYYLFPTRIIGFDIGKTHVTATLVLAQGRSRSVEKIFHRLITGTTPAEVLDRTKAAIASIVQEASPLHEVHSALPSSVLMFKECTVPFTTREKIALILDYEIEQKLPVSLERVVVDFIITRTYQDEQKSDVLVVAAQKQHLAEHISLFDTSGVTPQVIAVDIFSLYGLWQEIPAYASDTEAIALINLGVTSTRIALISNKQLIAVRVMPQGIMALVKAISSTLGIPAGQAHEHLIRFGTSKKDDARYTQAATQALHDILATLGFTLQSFADKTANKTINRIILLGGGADLPNIPAHIQEQLNMPTQLFALEDIGKAPGITLHVHPQASAVMSLSIALPTSINDHVNLRQKEFSSEDPALFTKQTATAATLLVFIVGLLVGNSVMQKNKLRQAIAHSEKQVLAVLQQTLDVKERRLDDAVSQAKTRVDEQRRIWFSFTGATRSSFLNHLQKLSTAIDKQSIGLQLKKLSFDHDTITMQGEVKDIASLPVFEEEIRRADLGTATTPQEAAFDIKITLKKEAEGKEA